MYHMYLVFNNNIWPLADLAGFEEGMFGETTRLRI